MLLIQFAGIERLERARVRFVFHCSIYDRVYADSKWKIRADVFFFFLKHISFYSDV